MIFKLFRFGPESAASAIKAQQVSDQWTKKYFGISSDPPPIWLSVVLWVMLVAGFAIMYIVNR